MFSRKHSIGIPAAFLALLLSLAGQVATVSESALGASGPSPPKLGDPPIWSPGKADVLFKTLDPGSDSLSAIFWTPVFKGGGGHISLPGNDDTHFIGGYIRPLISTNATHTGVSDFVLGGLYVDGPEGDSYEFQGELRLMNGLALGGGYVEQFDSRPDIRFGKIAFRGSFSGLNLIVSPQVQEFGGATSLGGYGAVYSDAVMYVGGYDGEQLRFTFGAIFPEGMSPFGLRPSMEVLFVDNTTGDFDGPKVLFINGSARYRGGFLSNKARLGRAMGPAGLEYGNPLGYLRPTWNRRLETWEIGDLFNYRIENIRYPDESEFSRYEALAFPRQLLTNSVKRSRVELFVGTSFTEDSTDTDKAWGVIGGFGSMREGYRLSIGIEYQLESDNSSATIGLLTVF